MRDINIENLFANIHGIASASTNILRLDSGSGFVGSLALLPATIFSGDSYYKNMSNAYMKSSIAIGTVKILIGIEELVMSNNGGLNWINNGVYDIVGNTIISYANDGIRYLFNSKENMTTKPISQNQIIEYHYVDKAPASYVDLYVESYYPRTSYSYEYVYDDNHKYNNGNYVDIYIDDSGYNNYDYIDICYDNYGYNNGNYVDIYLDNYTTRNNQQIYDIYL